MGLQAPAGGRWRRLGQSKLRLACVAIVLLLAIAAGSAWALRGSSAERKRASAARAAIAAGRLDEARALLDRWLAEKPNSAEAHFLCARLALERGDLAAVTNELSRAHALGYPDPQIERLHAIVLSRVGRYAEAEPILVRVLEEANGRDADAIEALARVYLETYRLPLAAKVIERWIRDSPNDAKPYLWLTEIDRRTIADNSVVTEGHYRAALARDPNLDKARLGLAETLSKAHAVDAAAREYDIYLARNPRDAIALVGAGRNALERGDEAAAVAYFNRALTIVPRDTGALKELALIDQRRGAYADALVRLNTAVDADPFDTELLYNRGRVHAALGHDTAAKADQDRVNQLKAEQARLLKVRDLLVDDPKNNDLRYEVAAWMFAHGRDDEAQRWTRMILADAPNHVATNRLLADYHERQGKFGLANYYRLQAASASP